MLCNSVDLPSVFTISDGWCYCCGLPVHISMAPNVTNYCKRTVWGTNREFTILLRCLNISKGIECWNMLPWRLGLFTFVFRLPQYAINIMSQTECRGFVFAKRRRKQELVTSSICLKRCKKNLRDYCKYISKYLTTSKLILLTQPYKMLILIVVKLFASIDVVKNHHRLVFKVLGSWTADHELESPQSFVHTSIYRVKFLKINCLFKIAYFLPIWLIYTSYASCYLS